MAELILSGAQLPRGAGPVGGETEDGQQWVCVSDSSDDSLRFFYRNSVGSSWTEDTGAELGDHAPQTEEASYAFFISDDDYAWVAYDDGSSIVLRIGRIQSSAITWDAVIGKYALVSSSDDIPGVTISVARVGGSGGAFYCIVAARQDTDDGFLRVVRWDGGSPTTPYLGGTFSGGDNRANFFTVDWQHTGDGKTAVAEPDFYMARSAGALTAQFYRYAYRPGPTWNRGTGRLDPAGDSDIPVRGFFDGTRFVFAHPDDDTDGKINVIERDAGDTTWTDRTPATDGSTGPQQDQPLAATWDPATGDIYVAAIQLTSNDLIYNHFNRSTGTWAGWTDATGPVQVEPGGLNMDDLHLLRAISGIYAIFRDDTTPTDVYSQTIVSYNSDPTAPTIDAPNSGQAQDVDETLSIDWTFNDPDIGDTQSAYTLRRRLGTGAYSYWTGSGWQSTEDGSTKISSSSTVATLSVGWGADSDLDHYYSIKTWDQDDAGPSDWSSEVRVVPSAQDNPTITAPLTSVDEPSTIVTWSVASQTKYRVKVFTDAALETLAYDSGVITSSSGSHLAEFDSEGTRYIWVQTWNNEGLASDPDSEDVLVSYDVPPTPTLTATADSPVAGAIRIAISNGSPGAGEIAATSNDIYRREGDDSSTEIRVAANVDSGANWDDYSPASGTTYKYQIVAFSSINTQTAGAWTA